MTVSTGDLVRLMISGPDAQEVRTTLDVVVPALVPVIYPTDGDARQIEHFDLFSLAMDFVVASAAGLSVEGIRSLIVNRLSRRRKDLESADSNATSGKDMGKADVTVTVKSDADGVIEITVKVR